MLTFGGEKITVRIFSGCMAVALSIAVLLPQSAIAQPNFVFIMTDDMAYSEVQNMPIVKASLLAEGMNFNKYYVTTPACCPSRASTLRGQYAHNHGVLSNSNSNGGGFQTFYSLGREKQTIATWLQQLGYRTGLVGKYLNGYQGTNFSSYVPPGWNDWHALFGSIVYYNYSMVENGVLVNYTTEYQTDVLRDRALSFIHQYSLDKRPFFLYFAPTAPHAPFDPAERHKGVYAGLTLPSTPSFNEADVSDKPAYIQALPLLSDDKIRRTEKDFQSRMEMLLAVDEAVEKIITALTEEGQLENTYIVFTSDNGWHSGEHRFTSKGTPYEESVRAPFIVRGPGVTRGSERSDLVLNIDIAPTLVELGGGKPPSLADGSSFARMLAGRDIADWRTKFLVELLAVDKADIISLYTGVHTSEYSYVHYFETGEKELYDLVTDPHQLANIAGVSPTLVDQFTTDLTALSTCAGATCRSASR